MAKKKFANLDDTFKEVAEASAKKANVYTLINIANADLVDYPKNQEDIENTADIENSIKELGVFSDPIEVTDYGQPDGKFMIISGHRRRVAGVKCGIEIFPCIARKFESEAEIYNYVLLSNSHRDSSKDPLLMPKRIKMHEAYLNQIKFAGNHKEEITKRLGISKSQVDRYTAMNRIILPVWDMVRDEIVSISGVFPLASHEPEEQEEIYIIMAECLNNGISLSREMILIIVKAYRDGKRTYQEIISDASDNAIANNKGEPTKQEEYKEPLEENTDDRADETIVSANDDIPVDENDNNEDSKDIEDEIKTENKNLKKKGQRQEIIVYLKNINSVINANSFNGDKEDAKLIINGLTETFETVINEMQGISKANNLDDAYVEFLNNILRTVRKYV